jgi:hypothetical protein
VVSMRLVATMHTLERVTFSVSSVPSVAGGAKLRSLEGVFHHKLNPLFWATPRFANALPLQQLHQSAIKPMRQPPVKHARERPSFAVLTSLQVLITKNLDRRPINFLQGITQHRFNFGVGILLTLLKSLNSLIKFWSIILSSE